MSQHERNTPAAPLTPVDWDSVTFTVTINKEPKQVPDYDQDPVQAYKDRVSDVTGDFAWEQVDADGNVIGNAWYPAGESPAGDGWRKEQVPDGAPVYPNRTSHGSLSGASYVEVDANGTVVPHDPTQPYIQPFGEAVVRSRAAADEQYRAKYGAVIAAIRALADYDYSYSEE